MKFSHKVGELTLTVEIDEKRYENLTLGQKEKEAIKAYEEEFFQNYTTGMTHTLASTLQTGSLMPDVFDLLIDTAAGQARKLIEFLKSYNKDGKWN